jgi:transcriptional regulator with XRE-family HTH domain
MAITPTVRRLQLGNELRRVREAAGKTQEDAAECIDASLSRMSRIELAQTKIALGDVKLLMEFYGAEKDYIDGLLTLARNNTSRGRWTGYRATYKEWFRMYVDLETDADTIQAAELEIIPGLLQTEDYIRALNSDGDAVRDDERISSLVRARKERQQVLTRDDPAQVSFVISESSLRRKIGRPERVMREQLEYLAKLAQLSNVQLQVLPFNSSSNAAGLVTYRFSLLSLPSAGIAPPLDFVYLEDYDDARYLDTHEGVKTYLNLWGRLQAAALGPAETLDFIREAAEDYR